MSTKAARPPRNTREVPRAHALDVERLARWLRGAALVSGGPLRVRQIQGGQSNPTFWIADGERQLVLRKKPPGVLLPSAHAVEREYRVLRALAETPVPVPAALALCEDPGIVGTPFYVMEYLAGRTFWDPRLPELERGERAAVYEELARVLAAIHQVDPAAVGLADYGRSGGYVARQIKRWSRQYRASETAAVPAMEALIAWLPGHVPAADEVALSHGDFRLDNLLIHPTKPRVLAVLDWELSTLGHPLADLAYTCMLYDVELPGRGGLVGVDHAASGVPSEADFVARYCALTGRAGVEDWPFYKAFSLFRLAAIAQGVYRRSLQGNASSEQAGRYGQAVQVLAEIACGLVGLRC